MQEMGITRCCHPDHDSNQRKHCSDMIAVSRVRYTGVNVQSLLTYRILLACSLRAAVAVGLIAQYSMPQAQYAQVRAYFAGRRK
eukprot:6200722-Pleurochrysis_carterae.AAC.6